MRLPIVLIAALVLALSAASTANAVPVVDGEFALPFGPNQVAPGPDGNMWVTLQGANVGVAKVAPDGTVTPYTSLEFQSPTGVVAGPDGNIWVTQSTEVVRFSPSDPTGTAVSFSVDIANPQEITVGPDGNLWTASADKVHRITPAAVPAVQTFTNIVASARGIAGGTDGRIWIAEFGDGAAVLPGITSVSTDGLSVTPHPIAGATPQDVAAGVGGQVAYTNPSNEMGRLTLGAVPAPAATPGADPFGITFGADQAYWTAQFATNNIGRLTSDGQYTTLGGFAANSGPRRIAAGPNNTLWVTLETTNKIARVSGLEPPVTDIPPTVSALSLTNKAFRVGRSATPLTARRYPTGTKIRLTLSEAATVSLSFERALPGRRSGAKCVRPRRSLKRKRKCTRYARVGTLTRQGQTGANSVDFSGRLGRKALKPGRYRVVVTAADAAGNASPPVGRSFRVVARG